MNKLTLINRLYEYVGYDGDSIMDDIKNGYLTENEGRDGHRTYGTSTPTITPPSGTTARLSTRTT